MPDAGQRRMAEHRRRDAVIIDLVRLVAEEGVGERLAFADRDRGQLDAVGDVADREDRRHDRAVVGIDLDLALVAELDARVFQPEALGVRLAADREQQLVGLDVVAAGHR